ncbi:MAG: ABC transporter permease [Bacteroidia bacterium]|nr:ABC transporter permease [Bacteroidia bacterium]
MDKSIVIEPGNEAANYWKDIWHFRSLFYFLAWRDVLVRYKQTTIGIAWSIVRPLLTMLVMAGIGWIFNAPIPNGIPRLLWVCAATLPWQFFSSAFSESSGSLVANANLLTKVYFPRMIVPISSVIVCVFDFLISVSIMLVAMWYYQYMPALQIVWLPFFMVLLFIIALGSGLFIAALNVKYRDFRYVIPFIVQFGLYVSPISFSSTDVLQHAGIPSYIKLLYMLNPVVGVIDGFRWCIFGNISIQWTSVIISVICAFGILMLGIFNFRRMEKSFADVI